MRLMTWFALVIFTTLSSPVDARESAAEAACIALATAAQSGCLEKLATAADARLNEIYQRAVAMIDKSGSADSVKWKAELKKAQQAWISFRDTDCGALIGYEWGHGTGMGSATESCLLHKAEQRSRELIDRYIHRR